jgi:hypothetical protein
MEPGPGHLKRLRLRLRLVDLEEPDAVARRLGLCQGWKQDGAYHPGGCVRVVLRGPKDDHAVVARFMVSEEFTAIAPWLRPDDGYHALGDRFRRGARSGTQIELDQPQVHDILLKNVGVYWSATW